MVPAHEEYVQPMSPRPHTAARAALALALGGALGLLVALAPAPGCDKVEQASEAQRLRANEQTAIQAYSAEVPRVDALLRSFTQIWREANELPDTKALSEAVHARVLPALRAYVDALGAMPTKTPALAAIHEPLVTAYKGALAAFQKFADGLTAANIEARYQDLLGSLDAIMRAEDAYYEGLRSYYEANGAKLTGDSAAAKSGPAAQPAAPAQPAALTQPAASAQPPASATP